MHSGPAGSGAEDSTQAIRKADQRKAGARHGEKQKPSRQMRRGESHQVPQDITPQNRCRQQGQAARPQMIPRIPRHLPVQMAPEGSGLEK